MKPYMVEIRTYGVVMAEDESHARSVADDYKRDIFNDDWNPSIDVYGEVVSVEKLGHSWNGDCLPYGGDGETRLRDLVTPRLTFRGEEDDTKEDESVCVGGCTDNCPA